MSSQLSVFNFEVEKFLKLFYKIIRKYRNYRVVKTFFLQILNHLCFEISFCYDCIHLPFVRELLYSADLAATYYNDATGFTYLDF